MSRVLIVGATSTVAISVAKLLVAKGDELFCVARNPAKLTNLCAELGDAVKGSFCYDFTDFDTAKVAIEKAVAELGTIDVTLICHGDLTDQLSSEDDFQVAKASYEINLMSVVALLIPLIKQMKVHGSGKVGVITSVAGDRGRPRNFTYGSAKGALSTYMQGLRSVHWGSGIEIYDFRLGPVDTPMSASHEKNFSFSTPDKVADLIVKALSKRRYQVYVPGFWTWVMLCVRNMPEFLFQRLGFLSDR